MNTSITPYVKQCRAALLLVKFFGVPVSYLAHALGVSRQTVYRRLATAQSGMDGDVAAVSVVDGVVKVRRFFGREGVVLRVHPAEPLLPGGVPVEGQPHDVA